MEAFGSLGTHCTAGAPAPALPGGGLPCADSRPPRALASGSAWALLCPAPRPPAPDSGCHACVPLGRLLITAGVLE